MKNLILKVAAGIIFFLILPADFFAQSNYVLATDNPFSLVSISNVASPTLGDIDGDGDLDLFVGQYNSNDMLFFRNTGTPEVPVYEEQTGTDNPLDVYTSNSGCNAPVLVDIDADGDLDVFVGIYTYIIRHLRNDGNASVPDFVFKYGADNPLDQVLTEGICNYPAFVDIDDDMDLDVFISDGDGNILFYENTGDTTSAVFVLDTINSVLGHVVLTHGAKIVFHDVSGDGLKDAVISRDSETPELLYFENIGTASNAVFEERTGSSNPFDGITGSIALVPVFADVDNDGDKDLVLGNSLNVRLYEAVNTTSSSVIKTDHGYIVYPNPARHAFTVQGDAIRAIEIIDQQGRLVRRLQGSGNTTLVNMESEAAGIFFVRMIADEGVVTRKIVLQ